MSKNFRNVKHYLESQHPEVMIDGLHHSPGQTKEMIAYLGGLVWTAGLILMFFGSTIFGMLGMATPGWFKYIKDNQMIFALGLFIMNNIAQGMMATGAFEIYYNGELMHSRLETGTFPTQATLDKIVQAMIAD